MHIHLTSCCSSRDFAQTVCDVKTQAKWLFVLTFAKGCRRLHDETFEKKVYAVSLPRAGASEDAIADLRMAKVISEKKGIGSRIKHLIASIF